MIVRPILSASRIHLGHGLASPQKQTCDVRLLNPLGCSWQCAKDRSVSSSSTCLALAVHAIACTATAQAWLRSSSPKWSSHPYSLQSCYKEPRYSRVREDECSYCSCILIYLQSDNKSICSRSFASIWLTMKIIVRSV